MERIVFYIWAACAGACLGSFYSLCAYRYTHALGIRGRSVCSSCGKSISARHLIPVISWLHLGGRCAYCRGSIGLSLLLTECVSGLSALAMALRYGPGLEFCAAMLIFGSLIVVSDIDARCHTLPDAITLPLAALSVPASVLIFHLHLLDCLLGGFASAALLLGLRHVFFKIRRVEGLGLGDVKLILSLGFLCGLGRMPLVLMLASLSALLALGVLRLAKGVRMRLMSEKLPFGPFLSAGAFIAMLYF